MENYSRLEEAQGTFSDLYKDVHGFRPRNVSPEVWNSADALYAECEKLQEELKVVMAAEADLEKANIAKFEETLTNIIASGAGDRETAIRWFIDAQEDEYVKNDLDYLCYQLGLPYGYFTR